jgi:hypothetical protein
MGANKKLCIPKCVVLPFAHAVLWRLNERMKAADMVSVLAS